MRFLAGLLLVLLAVVPLSQTFTFNAIKTYASSESQASSHSQFISPCCKGGRQRLVLCLRTPEGVIVGNEGLQLMNAGMIGMRGLVAGIKDESSVHGSVGARNQPSQTIKAFLSSPPSCVQKEEEVAVQPVVETPEAMVQVESDLMVWNDRLCEIMSSVLGMAALFLLVHCMYFLSLFTLGLRSVPAPWSLEAWRKAFIFARNDLAAEFVGTSIASCLYQPRVQITIDMRWVAALLGAVPFGRLFVPLTWPAVKVIVKVTERVLKSISSITGKLLLGAKDSDSRVVASHGKQDNQVADPASKQTAM